MIKSLYDMLVYVDTIDAPLGDRLYEIIDVLRNEDPNHPLLVDGVKNTNKRSLGLANEEDFFLVKWSDGVWEPNNDRFRLIIVSPNSEVVGALYVEHTGKYAHAVGDFSDFSTEKQELEVPPL